MRLVSKGSQCNATMALDQGAFFSSVKDPISKLLDVHAVLGDSSCKTELQKELQLIPGQVRFLEKRVNKLCRGDFSAERISKALREAK